MTRWFVIIAIALIPALMMREYIVGSRTIGLTESYADTVGAVVFLIIFLIALGISTLIGRRHKA